MRWQTENITHITVTLLTFLAGTPSEILDMAGAGTLHLSVTMRDLYGVAMAKVTFAVLIRSTVGILVIATSQFLTDGLVHGLIGRDLHPLTDRSRKKEPSKRTLNPVADEWSYRDVSVTETHRAQSAPH
jgi:hypothetical protein